jgi:2,4-dienoyl-CoA reductase-like NADH-dependent reductase (Old Yellow Enzyme family)/NADPH-dependent 2,4-dienoyl-CoA reductase/sulfur reductase-like enzyme
MSALCYPNLMSTGRIGSLDLKNRIIVTAMGVSLAEEDGQVGERQMAYHEAQAKGGAGLIVMGVNGVAWPVGAVSIGQAAISDDRFIPALRELTTRVHRHGAKIACQLHHGGLVAGYAGARWGHPMLAPSLPPASKGSFFDFFLREEVTSLDASGVAGVHVVTHDDIQSIISQFADAARRAKEAGFDGAEIHGGHGYLISSFISPYTNKRVDEYGGSLENRMRFAVEIIAAIRAAVGSDFPLWFKLDSREIGKDGITIEDAIQSAKMLEAAGVDAITVTSYHDTDVGKLHSESNIPHIEEWNLPSAAAIKSAVQIPIIGSGRLELPIADAAVRDGKLDFVAMGRKLLADPALPNKIAAGHPDTVRPCIYCYTCVSAIYMGDPVRCAVNSELGFEKDIPAAKASDTPRHIAVIGGGPGGMETARRLSAAGHQVTLIEKADRLGGTLRFASLAYEPNERLLDWLIREVEDAGVTVRLNTEATPELLRSLGVTQVVVATGALRTMPNIAGGDRDHVFSGDELRSLILGQSSEALKDKTSIFTRTIAKLGAATGASAKFSLVREATRRWMPLDKHIVIIGGELVGLELAEYLSERGRHVHVIDDAPRMGKGLQLVRRMRILTELKDHGVGLSSGVSDIRIDADAVFFRDAEGYEQRIKAGNVIVAKGATGDTSLADRLKAEGFQVDIIGDALGVTYIEGAMHGARRAAEAIG